MKKTNNRKQLIIGIIMCVVFCIFLIILYSLGKDRGINGLFINSEPIAIKEDILYYSEPLNIECDNCLVNNKKTNIITIKEAGDYEISYKNKIIKINISYDNGFSIYDYYGKEIHNYESNYLPFRIETSSEILVNGEKYNNQKIYKYGTYTIKNKDKEVEVKINEIKSSNNYDIFLTAGTLSSLYASLIMSEKDNFDHTFVWCGRDTFNGEYLSDLGITVSSYNGDSTNFDKLLEEVKKYIYEKLKKDELAHFNIYMNEVDYSFALSTVYELGLIDNRFNINIITDGTISYSMDYPYFKKDTYNYYKNYQKLLDDGIQKVYSGDNKGKDFSNKEFIVPFLVQSGAKYYLQYPNYFKSNDKKVNKELNKINYDSVTLSTLYDNLDKKQKEVFYKIINFDKDTMNKEYFNEQSKPYLILTGNTPMDYGFGTENFKKTIRYVVEKYSDDYIILFKPHPRAIPNTDYMKFFEELNIKVLPGQMPMEAISFVYDVKLGGFPGSLYMSSDAEDVLFFFAKDKNDMFDPLPQMIDETFKNVEIINPRKVV